MKIINGNILIILSVILLSSCSGIRYMNIETREPAKVTLPTYIKSVLVVNNVLPQPDNVGHRHKKLGYKSLEDITASSDSIAIYYTEALSQFLSEEGYFENVQYHNEPIRKDNDYWRENALDPEVMIRLRVESGADAIISLDKLIIQTVRTDQFKQEGYAYADITAKVQSIIRVYLPSLDGSIPAVQYNDSLVWEGFDIKDGRAHAEFILPTTEDAMKELAVYAAEKMTKVFSPHWEFQNRWLYTPLSSKMREGEVFAKNNQWLEAISKWDDYYDKEKDKVAKARAAHNIALAYEMLDDMESALNWATIADDLMSNATSPTSLDRRRSILYKNEIIRRSDTTNKLDMQNH